MAMNGNNLGTEIYNAFSSKYTDLPQDVKDQMLADARTLGIAIVNHITNNAEVSTTLDQSLNTIFTGGVPVVNDGGAALKTAWSTSTALGAKDDASGGVS